MCCYIEKRVIKLESSFKQNSSYFVKTEALSI